MFSRSISKPFLAALVLGYSAQFPVSRAQAPDPHAIATEPKSETSAKPESKSETVTASNYLSAAEFRMQQDVRYLAADAREGRGPGTAGIEDAASYIADEFKRIGLKPSPNAHGYYQKFTITNEAELVPGSKLQVSGGQGGAIQLTENTEFSPLALGDSGELTGKPLVFAGYGITAKEESLKLDYDDYAGIDVKGKVVLILRREPQLNDEKSAFAGKQNTAYAEFRHKATNAFQHGAAAVLLVNNLAGSDGKDPLLPFRAAGGTRNSTIPFVQITRAKADELLKSGGSPTLETLEKEIDADGKPHSREINGLKIDLNVTITRKGLNVKNVVN